MSNGNQLRVVDGGVPEAPVDPLIGTILDGRYKIEGLLGEGGMGVVYRAKHTALGKSLAVKVLRAEVSKDTEIVTRFRQEAQSATAIGNEHIIDISDFGALPDGSTYFVMEFLDGVSLSGALDEQRPLPVSRTIHIAKQLCDALGAAHERGIVHRDLKPDNIYLVHRSSDNDFVKVLDFGIAKVGGASSKLTRAGQVFGTPHYMSPEQCQGAEIDQRTDIYALGIIFYEMSAGRVPFDADNLMGILTKHLYEQPTPIRDLPTSVDVNPELESVILKALAKKVENRYQSMAEMRADLERIEAGTATSAAMEAHERSAVSGRSDGAARTAMSVELGGEIPGAGKSKMPLIVGGIAALALLGGAAVMLGGAPKKNDAAAAATPAVLAAPVPAPAVAPVPAPVVAKVKISSVPAGAEVYRNGALIGNTPFETVKPEGSEQASFELRLTNYVTKSVAVTALTSDTVTVSLDHEPVHVEAHTPAAHPASGSGGATHHTAPAASHPAGGGTGISSGGGVVDPWN